MSPGTMPSSARLRPGGSGERSLRDRWKASEVQGSMPGGRSSEALMRAITASTVSDPVTLSLYLPSSSYLRQKSAVRGGSLDPPLCGSHHVPISCKGQG